MPIRLYMDEDSMNRALVRALRGRSADVETALEVGMIEREDAKHLEYAADQGRALFTSNVGDFCHLHQIYLEEGRAHAGIIVEPRQSRAIGAQLRGLLALIAELSPEEMTNRLEFLSHWA